MRRFLLTIAFAGSILATNTLRAEIPRKDPPPGDTLQAVLDRIREHAASDNWKQPGWTDEKIEAWLDKLVGSVAKGANLPDLKLPVRLAEVKPWDGNQAPSVSGALFVANDLDLTRTRLRDCIVLADGEIEVGGLENCVVIARSTVACRGISTQSVIVSGVLISLSMDGRPVGIPGLGRNGSTSGSLVVSRGWMEFSQALTGTIVACQGGMSAGRSFNDIICINAPVPQVQPAFRAGQGSRSVTVNDLPVEPLPQHPLAAKVKLQGVLHGQTELLAGFGGRVEVGFGPCGIVLSFESSRFIADLGKPILDEAGNPVKELAGWKLKQITGPIAILSSPDSDLVLRVEVAQER